MSATVFYSYQQQWALVIVSHIYGHISSRYHLEMIDILHDAYKLSL